MGVAFHTFALHVEQAQSRQSVFFQQSFLDVLFLQLVNLCGGHLAAVGREFAISLTAYRDDLVVVSSRQECGK